MTGSATGSQPLLVALKPTECQTLVEIGQSQVRIKLDRLSAVGNYEINAEIYSEAQAQHMEELFTCDITNAFELTPGQWMSRPWYSKLSERILPYCA